MQTKTFLGVCGRFLDVGRRTPWRKKVRLPATLTRFVNRSFARRVSFYFVPLIILLSAAIAVLSFVIFFGAFRRENVRAATLLVEQIGVNFDNYFRDTKTVIAYLYDNTDVQRAFADFRRMSFEQRFVLNSNIDALTDNVNIFKPYLRDVLFLGKNGYQRNLPTYFHLDSTKRIIDSTWLNPYRGLANRRIYFSLPHMDNYYESAATPSLVMSAILPVFQHGTAVGFIVGDIDYDLLKRVLDDIYRQNHIDIAMISGNGTYVFARNPSRVNTKVASAVVEKIHGTKGEFSFVLNRERYLAVFLKSSVTGWYLLAEVPYASILKPSTRVSRTIIFVVLPISVLCAILMTLFLSRRVREPLSRLIERMEEVDVEKFHPHDRSYGDDEIGHLGRKFEEMLLRINQLVVQTYRLKLQQKDAQLTALRHQITPHFIYNALQLIKTEAVLMENAEISRIVTAFGNLLRYAIETVPSEVTIEDECNYVKDYLSIYRRRFGNSFEYDISLEPSVRTCAILKLVLQPIVENSIRHGLSDIESGGKIHVEVAADRDDIVVTVVDNGKGIPAVRIREIVASLRTETAADGSVGLRNVDLRVRLKNGPGYGITDIESRPGMTRIELRLKREASPVQGYLHR